jgi:hypothetical protein
VAKNEVHQKSIMEMLVRDLSELGYDSNNDQEIAEAVLAIERLRVIEQTNKALAEALVQAMKNQDEEALKEAIQDFHTGRFHDQADVYIIIKAFPKSSHTLSLTL